MKKLNYFTAIAFLSKYIRRHKKNFIMFYFGWFFDMLLGIIMPIMFGIMIDEIVYHQNLESFLRISFVFVIMSIFSCLLYFLIYAQHQYLMSMYVYDIQRDVFSHLQKCSAEYLADAGTGDIISIIQHYSRECMHFVIRNVIHMTNGCINIILLTIYVFIINPYIGLLMLAAVPISVIISMIFGKKIRNYSDEQRKYYGSYISYIYEVFTAIKDIRLLGADKKVSRNITEHHRKMFNVNIKSGMQTITAENIIDGTNLIIRLAIFTLTAYLASNGSMTIGLLTIVLAYFTTLTWKVKQVSSSYLDAQSRISYIQRIYDFMNTPTESCWQGKNKLVTSGGEIIFENVSFAYQKSSDVLRNFTLHIKQGERIAICGKSGCGKTTLGYVLLGFYMIKSGEILIDGHKLSDLTLKSIRKNIGIISQDVLLFDGSIKYNLLLGNIGADDDEVIDALKKAGIWEYISTLPDGINTIIGTKGIGLSGGQKQRIAIARIYLKNPPIIIFDEATSSLDTETEHQIYKAWEAVLCNRTSIIIAHRQSSVMLCDRAAIMEHGCITTIGKPQDMEISSKAFRELFALEKEVRA